MWQSLNEHQRPSSTTPSLSVASPRSEALGGGRPPRNLPMGVRAAPTMKTSGVVDMGGASRRTARRACECGEANRSRDGPGERVETRGYYTNDPGPTRG